MLSLRVMTYNLLYGFHERFGDAMVFQPARAEAAREVVRAEQPDILGLTEAVYCGERGRRIRQDFQEMFALPHLYADGETGDWANCLLSRYPLVRATRVPLGGSPSGVLSSALRATLDCAGKEVDVDLVHPSPSIREAERVEAFRPLVSTSSELRVMLGDFNSLSDEDPYTEEGLVDDMRPHVPNPEAIARIMLDRQLLGFLREHGLRDALAVEARSHTIPTRLHRASTQGAKLRIDYVLVSERVHVRSGKIIKSDAADRASDHYPLVVDLELG